ncbi:MAG: hypothetical protein HZB27_05080 [Meiothermus silvanus]|nr:hypothetical protein [Allomeiothermus silvanus]
MRRGLVWGLVAVYLALWVVGIEVQRHAQIPLSAQQIQASLDKVYEKSRAASVRIETIPEGIGSGFFISSDGYVMTAYHVIEGAKVLNVRTARDEVLRAGPYLSSRWRPSEPCNPGTWCLASETPAGISSPPDPAW